MINVPNTPHSCGDVLDPKLVDEITRKRVTPINPHAQRLLTAQARSAKAAPKAPGKAQKPKAVAKAKGSGSKRKTASHDDGCDDEHAGEDEGEPTMKRPSKKSKDMGNEPAPSRTEYMEAKKKFFQGNLYCKKSFNISAQTL